MKSQPEVEERLRAAPERLEVGQPPIERIVRRGRRRFATKVLGSGVAVIIVSVALVWTATSLSGIRQDLRLGDGTTIPKPRIVSTIPLSGVPWGVSFDGRKVWVTSYFDDLILGVDPDTNLEVDRIPVPGKVPYELVAGREGMWAGAFGSLLRIDPSTRRATDAGSHTGPGGDGYPSGMAVGGGALWLSDHQSGLILRVDPTTNRVVARIPVPAPTEIAFGGGSLWVAGCGEQGGAPLYRIDPSTNGVEETIRLPAPRCAGLPVVNGESLYAVTSVVEKDPNTRLWKIDRKTGRVIGGPVSVIAPGTPVVYRGVVWVLNREHKGDNRSSLTLIDATTMRVLARMSVGQNAWRIAVGEGSLWIPAMQKGRPVLLRIAP